MEINNYPPKKAVIFLNWVLFSGIFIKYLFYSFNLWDITSCMILIEFLIFSIITPILKDIQNFLKNNVVLIKKQLSAEKKELFKYLNHDGAPISNFFKKIPLKNISVGLFVLSIMSFLFTKTPEKIFLGSPNLMIIETNSITNNIFSIMQNSIKIFFLESSSSSFSNFLTYVGPIYTWLLGLFAVYFTVLSIVTTLSKDVNIKNSVKYVINSPLNISIISLWIFNFLIMSLFILEFENHLTLFLMDIIIFTIIFSLLVVNLIKLVNFSELTEVLLKRINKTLKTIKEESFEKISEYFENSNYAISDEGHYYEISKKGKVIPTSDSTQNASKYEDIEFKTQDLVPEFIVDSEIKEINFTKKSNKLGSMSLESGFIYVTSWNKLIQKMEKLGIEKLTIKKSMANEEWLNTGILYEYGSEEKKLLFEKELRELVKVKTLENVAFDDFLDLFMYSDNRSNYNILFKKLNGLISDHLEYNKLKMLFHLFHTKIFENVTYWDYFSSEFEEFSFECLVMLNKKSEENLDYQILDLLANLHKEKLKMDFKLKKEFEPSLNTACSRLNDYLVNIQFRYQKMNIKEFENIKPLINSIINYDFEILRFILEYPNIPYRKLYFRKQIQSTLNIFQFIFLGPVGVDETDFNDEIINNDELNSRKEEFLTESKKKINKNMLELMYRIMYHIDAGIYPDYFELAYEIYEFCKVDILDLSLRNFWQYDSPKTPLHDGVFSPINNSEKYRLLFFFKNYLIDRNFVNNISKIPDWDHYDNELNELLDKLDNFFVSKFMDGFTDEDLSNFKNDLKNRITTLKNKKQEIRNKQIIKADIYKKLVDNFRNVIKEAWERSNQFKKILKSDYVEKLSETPESPTEIGYNLLLPKEHFIDLKPFNEMGQITGTSSFGMNLARDKSKKIIKKILENLKNENIYEYSSAWDLKSKLLNIVHMDKNYFVITKNLFKIGVKYDEDRTSGPYIMINGKKIRGHRDFSDFLNEDVLLVEEGALKLIQYNALKDTGKNEALHISVGAFKDTPEDNELIKKLMSKDGYTEEDLKLLVQVKIFERYEVKDINPDKIWLFKKI